MMREPGSARATRSADSAATGEALAAFEKALNIEPGRESALVEAARLAAKLDRRPDAVAYFERAIAIDPWRSDYHAELAFAYFHDRKWLASAESCRAALRLNSSSLKVRKLLVQCYLNLGKGGPPATNSRRSLASIRPTEPTCCAQFAIQSSSGSGAP